MFRTLPLPVAGGPAHRTAVQSKLNRSHTPPLTGLVAASSKDSNEANLGPMMLDRQKST